MIKLNRKEKFLKSPNILLNRRENQMSGIELYQKIVDAQGQLQSQYQYWQGKGSNSSEQHQFGDTFASNMLKFYQAVVMSKDLERMFPQHQELIGSLIQLMDEIIKSLYDNTLKCFNNDMTKWSQMAGYILLVKNKADDLLKQALILKTFPEYEGKQLKHLKCPQNHWLQFEEINSFTCSRQRCGTIYHKQNQVRACRQCDFYACENCIHHQQA
ncbi:hypothetical protein pb186bvf_013925 [Paramecium bursaria]